MSTAEKNCGELRKAVVAVGVGSFDIDAANEFKSAASVFEENISGAEVFCAFTSASAVRSLSENHDIYIEYLPDLMEKLYMLGYGEVVFLSMFLNKSAEYEEALNMITPYKNYFKSLKITEPLLSDSGTDGKTAESLADILIKKYKNM